MYPNVGFEEHADLGFYHKKHDGKQQFLDNLGNVLSFECTLNTLTHVHARAKP